MVTPLSIHMISAIIWVGGMFFALRMLRPSLEHLSPPDTVTLWIGVLERFFSWIRVIVLLLPATGYWMVFGEIGGFRQAGLHVYLMHTLGWIMIGLFLWIYLFPFRRMKKMAREELIPEAGMYMMRIRRLVSINMVLGMIVSTLAAVGPFIY
ncbi:MAG: CopD family protein [Magnetococcales bacterium]|nr:CopD family protein [Magnetococcales bacterium]